MTLPVVGIWLYFSGLTMDKIVNNQTIVTASIEAGVSNEPLAIATDGSVHTKEKKEEEDHDAEV